MDLLLNTFDLCRNGKIFLLGRICWPILIYQLMKVQDLKMGEIMGLSGLKVQQQHQTLLQLESGVLRGTCRVWLWIVSHYMFLSKDLLRLQVTLNQVSMLTEYQSTSPQFSLTNKQLVLLLSIPLGVKLGVADQ